MTKTRLNKKHPIAQKHYDAFMGLTNENPFEFKKLYKEAEEFLKTTKVDENSTEFADYLDNLEKNKNLPFNFL